MENLYPRRKNVLITGGGGGMGGVMTPGLIEVGARVAAIDNKQSRLDALAKKASQMSAEGALLTLQADIRGSRSP